MTLKAYNSRASEFPLVRLILARPLLEAIEREGVEAGPLLKPLDLDVPALSDPEHFVPAPLMYRLVESLGNASADPCFGLHVGEAIDPWNWSPLAEAAATATTIGEFLLRFSISANEDASSVTYILETIGMRSTFHERRQSDGGIQPRHNDGFSIGYLLAIIRSAVGVNWEGARVVAHVCDPAVIPKNYLGIRLATGGSLGASLTFPSQWLLLPPQLEGGRPGQSPTPVVLPASDTVESLRQTLRPLMGEPGLDAERVASLFSISARTLARRLRANGTTLKEQLEDLRRERAEHLLRQAELPVSAVAAEVGYTDAAVFARAFRRWTGSSPSQYRKRARA